MTRVFIATILGTDGRDARLLLPDTVLDVLTVEPLVGAKLQQLQSDERVSIRRLDTSGAIETAGIFAEEIRVATPALASTSDRPFITVDAPERVEELTTEYDALYDASEPVDESFAGIGWLDFLEVTTAEFGSEFTADLKRATDSMIRRGTTQRAASLARVLCLVAARHGCEQKALGKLVDRLELVSRGTISNVATELEEANLITRRNVPVDRPGRPPKQLGLTDESVEPADYPEYLYTNLP